ncbi:helix-turn-helix domain-containing protein [Methylobacterium sp. CM6244]
MGVSLPTLRKLEKGDPSVSLGVFARAVRTLGLFPAVRARSAPRTTTLPRPSRPAAFPAVRVACAT